MTSLCVLCALCGERLLLQKHRFAARRTNPFVPDQLIVAHESHKRGGVELLDMVLEGPDLEKPRPVRQGSARARLLPPRRSPRPPQPAPQAVPVPLRPDDRQRHLAAGIGALVLSVKARLDREALREILRKTADKIGRGYDANGHSRRFGYGRVNAARAVVAALG
jgi:hypothetical protein